RQAYEAVVWCPRRVGTSAAGARPGQGPRAGGGPSLPHRLIRENGHPGWNHGGVDEIEVHPLRAVLEEAPPLPEQDWLNQDPILVNEVVFQQAVHEVVAAIHDQVLTGLLLELGDALRDIAFDQMGVLPLQVLERG